MKDKLKKIEKYIDYKLGRIINPIAFISIKLVELVVYLQKDTRVKCISNYGLDKRTEYRAERRVFLFFWTTRFKAYMPGYVTVGFSSSSKHLVEEWIRLEKWKESKRGNRYELSKKCKRTN